jgi:SAM-dependent methyltransferase
MATIHWFDHREAMLAAAEQQHASILTHDVPIAAMASYPGYCPVCEQATTFQVHAGATRGGNPPNLREGLHCLRCRLTARHRLMYLAMHEAVGAMSTPSHGALLERTTLLYRRAHAAWPWLTGSEYLGDHRVGGRAYWWSPHWRRWWRIRHESITALSHATGSLDLLAHSDVLEHVYATDLALRESARVLRPGGMMIFTVPFYIAQADSQLRGRPRADGSIEHLHPPEYHGDGVRTGGIYTFHHLGWDLLARLCEAGFARAEIGFCHAPEQGLAAADPTGSFPWCTLPLIFRATR